LVAKAIKATNQYKQFPVRKLLNVRTVLVLGTLTVQIALIMNSILGSPLREISAIKAAFSQEAAHSSNFYLKLPVSAVD
jgi:hypothetical protein